MSSNASSSSTPNNNNPSKVTKSKHSSKSKKKMQTTTMKRMTAEAFTAKMQDRQARNKDPYKDSDESDESMWEGHGQGRGKERWDAYGNDTYENTQKRREAAVVLDNPELLMMHSQARGDSIPGTRQYFRKLLCGYQDPTDLYPLPQGKWEANLKEIMQEQQAVQIAKKKSNV